MTAVSQMARDDPAGIPQFLRNLRMTLHGLDRSVKPLDEGGRKVPVRNDGHMARVASSFISTSQVMAFPRRSKIQRTRGTTGAGSVGIESM